MTAKINASTSSGPSSIEKEASGQSMRVRRSTPAQLRHAEVVIALPTEIRTVSSVRSTLLASSLQVVRERSLIHAYTQALPRRHHDQVLRTLAPVWLPLDAALAHYQAMDSLGLSEEEVLSIGRSVGDRLHGTFLGTLVRGVAQAGLTIWSLAGKGDRVWSRVFDGGAVGVVKLGPKEGIMSIRGLPLLSINYFRVGWRGVLCASVEAIAQKCYVRERATSVSPDGIDFIVSWV